MSKYHVVKTQFKRTDSLILALADIGYAMIDKAPDLQNPSLPLVGYLGDIRPELASIRIPRRYVGGASNDVGFVWNPQARVYEALISEYDSLYRFTDTKMGLLAQRYAYHEVKRNVRSLGYTVIEIQHNDGSVELELERR